MHSSITGYSSRNSNPMKRILQLTQFSIYSLYYNNEQYSEPCIIIIIIITI